MRKLDTGYISTNTYGTHIYIDNSAGLLQTVLAQAKRWYLVACDTDIILQDGSPGAGTRAIGSTPSRDRFPGYMALAFKSLAGVPGGQHIKIVAWWRNKLGQIVLNLETPCRTGVDYVARLQPPVQPPLQVMLRSRYLSDLPCSTRLRTVLNREMEPWATLGDLCDEYNSGAVRTWRNTGLAVIAEIKDMLIGVTRLAQLQAILAPKPASAPATVQRTSQPAPCPRPKRKPRYTPPTPLAQAQARRAARRVRWQQLGIAP